MREELRQTRWQNSVQTRPSADAAQCQWSLGALAFAGQVPAVGFAVDAESLRIWRQLGDLQSIYVLFTSILLVVLLLTPTLCSCSIVTSATPCAEGTGLPQ